MKRSVLTVLLLFLSVYSVAATKSFIKEDTAVVPTSQSQDQVVAYLTQKLTREAIEEAGLFVKSELKIESGQITKEEITNITGSIASIKVENKETYTENKQQYVRVKVLVKVDTDSVKLFLQKIKEDNSYKAEIEELRRKNSELEQKLKNSTKQEYNKELSLEVQKQIELQRQMAIEYNKIALEAKKELSKVKIEQEEKNARRESDLAQLKADIIRQKEVLTKAEIDSKNKIKELEIQAKSNAIKNQLATGETTIQSALKDATLLREQTQKLLQEFQELLQTQKETIENHYAEEIRLSCDNSPKSLWESDIEYNERIQKNQQIKDNLEAQKEEALFSSRKRIIEALIPALSPFINSLKEYHKKSFEALGAIDADFIGINDVDRNNLKFNIKVNFLGKEYDLAYDFSDIGLEKAKLLYETQNQFIVKPLFTVSNEPNKLDGIFVGFKVIHLGTDIKKEIVKLDEITECTEIDVYNNFLKEEANIKMIETLDKQVQKHYNEFKQDERLRKFATIINDMESNLNKPMYLKYQNLEKYKAFINKLDQLDSMTIDFVLMLRRGLSFTDVEIISLFKDGTVKTYSNDGKSHFKGTEYWKDIKYISQFNSVYVLGKEKNNTIHIAPLQNYTYKIDELENHKNIKEILTTSLGFFILKNNGDMFEKEPPRFSEKLLSKNVKSILETGGCIVALKKDGHILLREYFIGGQSCPYSIVQNWENIQKIWGYDDTIIALTLNGKLLIHSNNKERKENIKKWKNIVDVKIDGKGIYGLDKGGRVFAFCQDLQKTYQQLSTTDYFKELYEQCQETKEWEDIKDISSLPFAAITNKGTVVQSSEFYIPKVQSWKNIVKIQIRGNTIVGLDQNGDILKENSKFTVF